jgi:hypothetical protein
MIKKSLVVMISMATLSLPLLSACTQMPTERQGVTDLRPQLSFRAPDENMIVARVQVDGLDMGSVGDYLDGKAALRVLAGNHMIRIDLNGQILLEERLYVGDGVNRVLLVK